MRFLRIVHVAIGIFALISTTVFARDFRDDGERDGFRAEVSARKTERSFSDVSVQRNFADVAANGKSAGTGDAANAVIISIDSETGTIYRYETEADGRLNIMSVDVHAGIPRGTGHLSS